MIEEMGCGDDDYEDGRWDGHVDGYDDGCGDLFDVCNSIHRKQILGAAHQLDPSVALAYLSKKAVGD